MGRMAQTMASLNGITSEVSSRLESGYCNVEAGSLNNWVGALLHKENTIKAQIVNGVIAAGLVLGGVCTALCQLGSEKDATIPTNSNNLNLLTMTPHVLRARTNRDRPIRTPWWFGIFRYIWEKTTLHIATQRAGI